MTREPSSWLLKNSSKMLLVETKVLWFWTMPCNWCKIQRYCFESHSNVESLKLTLKVRWVLAWTIVTSSMYSGWFFNTMQYLKEDGNEFWTKKLCTILEDYSCILYKIMRFLDNCITFVKMHHTFWNRHISNLEDCESFWGPQVNEGLCKLYCG